MTAVVRRSLIVLVLVALGAGGVWILYQRWGPSGSDVVQQDVWTCSMHPEIREHMPGKCPKCGMDLVRASSTGAVPSSGQTAPDVHTARSPVQLDTRRRQLLGVRTARVEKRRLTRTIRAVGLVRYDETRLTDVNLKLDGWAKRLHIDSTGQAVRRGQPLLDFYSPDLLASQNEYVLALATRDALQESQVPDARVQADRLVESARQRLALWDLPTDSLDELERTRKGTGTVTFPSPASGYVIDKPVVEGMRVMAGQTLYRVADLSTVWVEADVFESDSPFVRIGAPAAVTLDAWPGERWQGRAVHIHPSVEEKTRTLRVRLSFPNPDLRLKPGMYANVELFSSLGTGLTVPSDAVLDTGREQLVFVAEGDGYYAPRSIEVGQRLDDRVQVLRGLREGDEVATGASFFLDSESQLRAATGGWESQAGAAGDTPAPRATITFRTDPTPPRNGENSIEVRVTDAAGIAIEDARVRVVFHMAAMPSMNMPAMTSETTLSHAGGGTYRGRGLVSMIGRWEVTVTATRSGQRLGTLQTTIVAK